MKSNYSKILTWVGVVVLMVFIFIVIWGMYDTHKTTVKKENNDTIKKAMGEKTLNKTSPMGEWVGQVN